MKKTVGELTWGHHGLDNRPDPDNELRGNENGKCTGNQLVLKGHGIYPKTHPISNELISIRREQPDLNAIATWARKITMIEYSAPTHLDSQLSRHWGGGDKTCNGGGNAQLQEVS
jgi:hypothetical protein